MERIRQRAFTIAELLVVVAVVAILAAILFPVLVGAKKRSGEATCINQLRQVGAALQVYRNSNGDELPHYLSDIYPEFLQDSRLFQCPLDPLSGKREGTDRLEGSDRLKSGVSYTWVPNWKNAIDWGWWQPWPDRGPGKWTEQTPVSECHWHWAKVFNKEWRMDRNTAKAGNAVILTQDGAIHFWPGKRYVAEWTP
jgi:prepilin-type N-terminal cleavage/methylation domain-containing protein